MLPKNKRLSALFALTISLLSPAIFTGCLAVNSEESDHHSDDGADLPDSEYCKNLGSKNSITLTGVSGKILFYANYNNASPDSYITIPANSTRYITSTSGIDEDEEEGAGTVWVGGTWIGSSRSVSANREKEEAKLYPGIKKFQPPKALRKSVLSGFKKRGASAQRSAAYSHGSNPIYNNQQLVERYRSSSAPITRKIFVDTSTGMDTYAAREATLCAIGYYNDQINDQIPVALVWVVNGYLGDECIGTTVNQRLAQDVADKFAAHYYHERAIFGEEYDFLFDANCRSSPSAAYRIKDTGSLVNIVIYDIGNDFESSSPEGVAGYFFGEKDYFKRASFRDARAYSNEGKYFYLDSAFCNYQQGGDYVNPTSTVGDLALTTLFHEFQHMINFGQKTIYGIESETWYNEMLSMLCEDMMADQLGTRQKRYTPSIMRINDFKNEYFFSGIDEFRSNCPYTISSYGTAYTFGAWLSREFGGPQFVRSMSRNHDYANMDSVLYSIREITGREYSKKQIYKLFIQACIFRDDFAKNHNLPSMGKDAGGSITAYGQTSQMPAIETLFCDNSKRQTLNTGPWLFANRDNHTPELRPHGFAIHTIGRATSDTVTLNFSSRISSHEDVMIYIQDDFED